MVTALLAAWMPAGTGVAGATPDHHAATVAAPTSPLPVALWRPCPNGNRAAAEHRVVRAFERSAGYALGRTIPAGNSDLVCGRIDYGYYHIVDRHFNE